MAKRVKGRVIRPFTVNETLQDAGIRHSVFMQRFRTQEANKIIRLLNTDVLPDALRKLESRLRRITAFGIDPGPVTTQRLKDTVSAVSGVLKGGIREAGKVLSGDLQSLALNEAQFQKALMDRILGPFEISFEIPDARTLRELVTKRPMRGKILREWFEDLSDSTTDEIGREISIGVSEGESIAQITKRVTGTSLAQFQDGSFGKLRRQAEAITRTAVTHISTQAREATYAANTDVVKSVQYVATLDSRTTDICASLDGMVFDINKGPRPPMHFQCRSTTIPIVKSFRELGIKLKDAPPGTRASLNGQVPATLNYNDWLKTQDRAFQVETLGPARAKLFREGVPVQKFVDRRNKPLTLKQIRRREGIPAPERRVGA